MVESNKNKGLLIGVAAGAALVGAALLYHFLSEGGDESSGEAQIMEELKKKSLDVVKKNPQNSALLDPHYLLQLMNFVSLTGRERRSEERDEALERRLELYKQKKDVEYRELVSVEFENDNTSAEAIMQEMMGCLGIDMQEFQMSMQNYARDPQFQQMMSAAQMGKLPEQNEGGKPGAKEEAPKLSKQKTLAAFEITKQSTMETLGKQAEMQKKMQNGQGSEMDMMIDMFVEQAKLDDELFIKCGVRNDELEKSMMWYIGAEDPDVKKAMTQYMMQMQVEMRKHGGGGMMPGM